MNDEDTGAPTERAGRRSFLTRMRAVTGRVLRSVAAREGLALVISAAFALVLVAVLPRFDLFGLRAPAARRDFTVLMVVVTWTAFTTSYAVITHLVLRRMSRRALLVAVSSSLRRNEGFWARMLWGRSTTLATAVQMLGNAALVVVLLLQRPAGVPAVALMVLAVFSVASAWVCCAVGCAMEYVRADERGEGFAMQGCPDPLDRRWDEYLFLAVLVQTSSSPADFSPLTVVARRAMRRQAVLAHITSTVLLAVTVSALTTAL